MTIFKKLSAFFVFVGLISFLSPLNATAAALTDLSDTMTSQKVDAASDHEILFTTPSGVGDSENFVVTFPSDFDGSSLVVGDVDMNVQSSPSGACDGTDQDLVASGATSSQWNAVFSGTENRILTFTSGGATADAGAGDEICVEIGTNATGGSNQYANPSSTGNYEISIDVNSSTDTGSITVPILTDDQVAVTAEVGQTLTFAIGDSSIGFGTLDSGNPTYATGDGNGTGTKASAHDITVGTNATSGYTVTYNGSTLTHGNATDTIGPATISTSATGTTGSEQFAIAASAGAGDATIASGYEADSNNWDFTADTTTTLVSETAESADETIDMFYLANIATLTPAGNYSTAITYTGTANF